MIISLIKIFLKNVVRTFGSWLKISGISMYTGMKMNLKVSEKILFLIGMDFNTLLILYLKKSIQILMIFILFYLHFSFFFWMNQIKFKLQEHQYNLPRIIHFHFIWNIFSQLVHHLLKEGEQFCTLELTFSI